MKANKHVQRKDWFHESRFKSLGMSGLCSTGRTDDNRLVLGQLGDNFVREAEMGLDQGRGHKRQPLGKVTNKQARLRTKLNVDLPGSD